MKVRTFVILSIILLILVPSILYVSLKIPGVVNSIPDAWYRALLKYFPNQQNQLLLQKANSLYTQWEFLKALREYKKIRNAHKKLQETTLYNIGNTYYRIGEQEYPTNKLKTYNLWNLSIDSYLSIIKWKKTKELYTPESKKTRENIAFVRKKLDKLKQELRDEGIEDLPPPPPPTFEENGQEDPNPPPPSNMPQHRPSSPNSPPPQNTTPPRSQTPNQWKWEWEQNSPNPSGPDDEVREFPKADSDTINEHDLIDSPGLSKEKRKEIENRIRELKEEEHKNIQLNKPSRRNENVFDILNDPFFDTINPNESSW